MHIISNDGEVRLDSAILLYKSKRDGENKSFATVHPIRFNENEEPIICPGTPASRKGVAAALRELSEDRIKPALLPAHILARGNDHLVWYRPAMKRPVWFRCAELGERTAVVPHPATLWLIAPDSGQCFVFALRDDQRPDETTRLFQAPYFNVWNTGRVCIGSAGVPQGEDALNPANWETMFYDSWFSHPNTPKLVRHKEGSYAFWRNLLDGKHRVFPKAKLMPTPLTLGQAFDNLISEG